MSATIARRMNNAPAFTLFARLREAVRLWRRRSWERNALLQLDSRDLHDLGLSRAAAIYEANKPFWRD
jgi:uncharacterized protein YjiS (DUF1127 family)